MRRAAALVLALAPACATGQEATFVVLGENGQAVARVMTAASACPLLEVSGRATAMMVRAPAQTIAERPTASTPENAKPTAFPVMTCEAYLPAGSPASIGGTALPSLQHAYRKIVVIGDTGCRLKASDDAYQACNDPKAYPFARIAARAAAWKPDLVIHVGDYLYRENPCVESKADCRRSPWGYGWDAWNADLFEPGKPLLAAAPWIVIRGNHENCARAGQGWWRFVDPRPLAPGRDCNDAANDARGDAASAYAVPIGGGATVVVADLATAGDKPIAPTDPRFGEFAAVYDGIRELAAKARFAFVATHKPIVGLSAARQDNGQIALRPATTGIQSVFSTRDPNLLPETVDVALAGHVHLWEQISYPTRYPTQFIAGFSGTLEDVVPLPAKLPIRYSPVSDAVPEAFSSWTDGFGFMTLERRGLRHWSVRVRNVEGRIVNRCSVEGRRSHCSVAQVK